MKYLILILTLLFLSCGSLGPKNTSKTQIAPASSPNEIKQINTAQKLIKRRRITQAKKNLNNLLATGTNTQARAEAGFMLGQLEYENKNYKAAYKYFIDIINSELSSVKEGVAYYKAARSLEKLGQVDEALSLASQGTLRSDIHQSSRNQLHQLKVRLHSDLKDYMKALDSAHYLSLNHDKVELKDQYKTKAQNIVELKLEDHELKSVASYSKYESLRPYVNYRLGFNAYEKGDFSEAKSRLRSVMSDAPSTPLADNASSLISQIDARNTVNPMTVGAILPLSGRYANFAEKVIKGLQLGLGIYGKEKSPIKLSLLDSGTNADTARKAVERIVTEDNVIAIVGGLLSKTSSSISAKSNELGVPNITLSQASHITDAGEYVFQNALTSRTQVKALVDTAMNKMKFKRFAILYPNDKYGTEFSNLFWDEVKARGGEITAVQTYNPKETDFNSTVKRLVGTYFVEDRKDEYKLLLKEWLKGKTSISRRSEPPQNLLPPILNFDAIFIPDRAKTLAQLAPMLAYHDVDNITLLGTNLWNSKSFLKRGGRYVEGAIMVDSNLSRKEVLNKTKFYAEYKNTFNEEPSSFAAQAYDIGLILRQAISAGKSSRIGVNNYFVNTGKFNTSAGVLTLNKHREFSYPLISLTIEKGQIKTLQ